MRTRSSWPRPALTATEWRRPASRSDLTDLEEALRKRTKAEVASSGGEDCGEDGKTGVGKDALPVSEKGSGDGRGRVAMGRRKRRGEFEKPVRVAGPAIVLGSMRSLKELEEANYELVIYVYIIQYTRCILSLLFNIYIYVTGFKIRIKRSDPLNQTLALFTIDYPNGSGL